VNNLNILNKLGSPLLDNFWRLIIGFYHLFSVGSSLNDLTGMTSTPGRKMCSLYNKNVQIVRRMLDLDLYV
jgi:hypothetical protein